MDRLSLDSPTVHGATTLLTVVSTRLRSRAWGGGLWFEASKRPVAVIVAADSNIKALGVDGADADLDRLKDQVPELVETLQRLGH